MPLSKPAIRVQYAGTGPAQIPGEKIQVVAIRVNAQTRVVACDLGSCRILQRHKVSCDSPLIDTCKEQVV